MDLFTIIIIIVVSWIVCVKVGITLNINFDLKNSDPELFKSTPDITNNIFFSLISVLIAYFLGGILVFRWGLAIYYAIISILGLINLLILFFSGLISDIQLKKMNKICFLVSFMKLLSSSVDVLTLYFILNKCFNFSL